MKSSDRQLLTRVAVGMTVPPAVGAVLVAIAGWAFNAQARAMLAASGLVGGATVGAIQLWDRRQDGSEAALEGLRESVDALNGNLSDLLPPALPPAVEPHPEAPAISVPGVTVPPTGPAPTMRVDVPDPAPQFNEADLIETDDVWAESNGSNSSYTGGFYR
jgi:hypothetical protein